MLTLLNNYAGSSATHGQDYYAFNDVVTRRKRLQAKANTAPVALQHRQIEVIQFDPTQTNELIQLHFSGLQAN